MSTSNPNSVIARTLFRSERLLKRMQRLIVTPPQPQPFLRPEAIQPATDPGDPKVFQDSTYGSGAYGQWVLDESELPAYLYRMNQFEDDHAKYPFSDGAFRRDHWHQVG